MICGGDLMNTVTYPYSVIMNGEIIPANTPIEVKPSVVEENTATEQPEAKAVKKNDTKRGRKS